MIRLFLGLWLTVVLGALGYGYVVELLNDIRRGPP